MSEATGHHTVDTLFYPDHIGPEIIEQFVPYKNKTITAVSDYKYWGGDAQPWRNGVDDSPVTDDDIIARETKLKRFAENEDDANSKTPRDHSENLRHCGLRIDFLLALTFVLDMWGWETWQVVQYLVKPATETEQRCRFADLPNVRPYSGAATVFMSVSYMTNLDECRSS